MAEHWGKEMGTTAMPESFPSVRLKAKCVETNPKLLGERAGIWEAKFQVDAEGQMGRKPIDSGGWTLSGRGRCPFVPGDLYDVTMDYAGQIDIEGVE